MNGFRRLVSGGVLAALFALPLLTASPAKAWWGPRWGWRGGVLVAPAPVVVGPPVFFGPRVYGPGYAPVYARYPYPAGYRWIPRHFTPGGWVVPGHWGY